MRSDRATGGPEIVILLFTDLVGSTELFQRLGDDAAEEVRRVHFRLLRDAVAARGGEEVKNLGDGLMVVFSSAMDAVASAVAIQEAVRAYNERSEGPPFHVRVGLDVGEPIRDEGDYFGTPVIVAKRLCDAARGDQILASQLVAGLVGSRGGFSFRSVGRLRLKGLAQPVPAVDVDWAPDQPRRQPGRRSSAVRRPVSAPAAARGPKLVGRDRQLATLEAELARAAAGEFRCLLVLGEPGVGKTRLAAELVARRCANMVVLSARAYPLGETAAFGVWAEALERQLVGLDALEITELCGGFLDDLAALLHSVATVQGSAPRDEPPRLRLLDGIGAVLRNLARQAPLLVVVDDVHLADASSWEVLQHLARQLSDVPLLVLATARPIELGEQVLANEVLFALEQDGTLERLRLEPLDTAGVAALAETVLGEPPPGPLVAWLDDRCRGNPLFAHGLLRALLEEGADLSAPALHRLPESLADRVKTRLAHLDPGAVEMLELMAALGRRVELAEIGRLSGRAADDLEDVLVRLTRSRMVLEDERGHELVYEISHPLVQEAIYQGTGALRRRRLHREIARWLQAAGHLAEAAPHFARGAEIGDPEAVDVLREAMRQAESRGAFREALGILGHLVELLPPGDERWLSVLDAMSRQAEWVIDHRPDEAQATIGVKALRAIDAVVERLPDPGRRATVKARLASFLAWGTAEIEEAESVAREAAGLFHLAGDQASVLLMGVELAYLEGMKGDWRGGAMKLRQVIEAAEAAGDRFAALQAMGVLGQVEFCVGDFAGAEVKLRRAVDIARADDKTYRLTWNLSVLGFGLGWEGGRTAEALAAFEEARVVNPAWWECNVLELESTVHFVAGDYRQVLACAKEAQARNPGGMSRRRSQGVIFAAPAAAELGLEREARRYAAAARRVLGERDWAFLTRLCTYGEAMIAARASGPHQALPGLSEAAAGLLRMEMRPFTAPVLVDLAETAAAAGQETVAQEAADHLVSIADYIDRPLYHGLAALGAAWAATARDARDEAASAARLAVDALAGTGSRGFHGRALDVLGRSIGRSDRAGAIEAYQEAARLFEACGVPWRREHAVEALRALRGRGQKAAAALLGPTSLTPREREVARLAASGLTAREIAKQLIVGQRTVEGHLANIYAKLGVRSKVELARRASELDL